MAQQDFIIQEGGDKSSGFAISEIKSFMLERRSTGAGGTGGKVMILFMDIGRDKSVTFHGSKAEALYKELRKLSIVI